MSPKIFSLMQLKLSELYIWLICQKALYPWSNTSFIRLSDFAALSFSTNNIGRVLLISCLPPERIFSSIPSASIFSSLSLFRPKKSVSSVIVFCLVFEFGSSIIEIPPKLLGALKSASGTVIGWSSMSEQALGMH